MRIGILGTGVLAGALGGRWAQAGHDLVIGGRSRSKAQSLASQLGSGARAGTPRQAVAGRDAVLLAVVWEGVRDALEAAGAPEGTLDGVTLIDPVNAVEHGVGVLRTAPGVAAAREIASMARGARVVKAFHLFPASLWTVRAGPVPARVAMCGDDPAALHIAGQLARDAGAIPAVLGSLDRARQLEEVAGFVIGLAFTGVDPRSAIPSAPTPGTASKAKPQPPAAI
jgi:predicted dinucleotide-binding enzyme